MADVIFFLGTGRSGTYSIFKSLSTYKDLRVHHEFMFEELLKLGTLKFHGLLSSSEIVNRLRLYRNALFASLKNESKVIDISNALPLLMEELRIVFPNASFYWVTRNAYKVTASFYFKFEDLMYPEFGINKIKKAIIEDDLSDLSPDKRVFRPLYSFNSNSRLLNILYHWKVYEGIAIRHRDVFEGKYTFEKLVEDSGYRQLFFENLGLKVTKEAEQFFEKPTNIQFKKNFTFTDDDELTFNQICGELNSKLGYSNNNYDVEY